MSHVLYRLASATIGSICNDLRYLYSQAASDEPVRNAIMALYHACRPSGWQQVAVQHHASRKFFPYASVRGSIYFEMAPIKVPDMARGIS